MGRVGHDVCVYALRLKMKDVRKRKNSQVVKREKRGRGRCEGLGLVQTQRWERFIVEDGRGDAGSLYGHT